MPTMVAAAHKATPMAVLHPGTMIVPMQEHPHQLQAKTRTRLRTGRQAAFMEEYCKKVVTKLGTVKVVSGSPV